MNNELVFLGNRKCLVKHIDKPNLVVWFNGQANGDMFSGHVVSPNKYYEVNFTSNNWKQEQFRPLNKNIKI
jgi:hypothetical protein